MKTTTALLVILAIIICVPASAAVPPIINYQGKLLQPSGAPVPDGTYSVQFAIYAAPTGGTPLWSETNTAVQVKGGLFAVLLGSVNNLGPNIFDQPNRFFGVKVGSDPEMTPRQQIASVAFAQKAASADVATTVPDGAVTAAKIADGSITAAKMGAQQAWIAPTLMNGWVNYGPTDYPMGYMKDSLGFVHILGLVRGGTMGVPVFVLQAGYRPAYYINYVGNNSNSNAFCGTINANGEVHIHNGSVPSGWFMVDVSFRAEQ